MKLAALLLAAATIFTSANSQFTAFLAQMQRERAAKQWQAYRTSAFALSEILNASHDATVEVARAIFDHERSAQRDREQRSHRTPHRVCASAGSLAGARPEDLNGNVLRLDGAAHVSKQRVIESGTPRLDSTHGVVIDAAFYYLKNTGWNQLDSAGKVKPGTKLTPALVMRYKFPRINYYKSN